MMIKTLIFATYILILFSISYYGYKASKKSVEDYFLAGRGVGVVVLVFTMFATNFSAYFFLGFAGAGYTYGWGEYAMMSFGTGYMALILYLVAKKAWLLGKKHNYLTPPELMGGLLRSKAVRQLYLWVMLLFTLPYVATQSFGAGELLRAVLPAPWWVGSVLITAILVGYVWAGGMRSVAWSDVVQGILMITSLCVATSFVVLALGGYPEVGLRSYANHPELYSRPGGLGAAGPLFTPQIWLSFMLLWAFADPMFPQLFQRCFIGKDRRTIRTCVVLYPLITAFLFFFPVAMGVWGRLAFPNLGVESPTIIPRLLSEYTPTWVAAFVTVAGLAALMSTADSQLLVLGSMVTRDLYKTVKPGATTEQQTRFGKSVVVFLGCLALLITILAREHISRLQTFLVKTSFTGLAVLCPPTLAALYIRGVSAKACVLSILAGETLLAGLYTGLIPETITFGFLWVVPVLAVTTTVL
ncbi:MAG: sodium:solute symporter family protein, partial [Methanobacteriota archaeon]